MSSAGRKIMAPPSNCISPIGEKAILHGLYKQIKGDFYTAVTRPPSVYRGNPFVIEAGLAFGKGPEQTAKAEKPAQPLAEGEQQDDDKDPHDGSSLRGNRTAFKGGSHEFAGCLPHGQQQRLPVAAHQVEERKQSLLRAAKRQERRAGAVQLPQLVPVAPFKRPDVPALYPGQLELHAAPGAFNGAAQWFVIGGAQRGQLFQAPLDLRPEPAQRVGHGLGHGLGSSHSQYIGIRIEKSREVQIELFHRSQHRSLDHHPGPSRHRSGPVQPKLLEDRRVRRHSFFRHTPPEVLDVCQVPVGARVTK